MKKVVLFFILSVVTIGFSFSQISASEYYSSALINDSLKDDVAAMHDIDNALRLKPDFDSALCLLATINLRSDNYKDAIKLYDKVIKLNDAYFDAFYGRGSAKAQIKDYPGAIKDYNKAIVLNFKHTRSYYNRALAKGFLEDYSSAIDDLDKAIVLDNTYASAYYSRGYWKDISGDFKGAIADYKRVIVLDPTYKEAYISMATAMYEHGDKIEACDVLRLAAFKGSIMADELVDKLCN